MDNDTKIRTAYDYLVNHVSYIDWDQREGANAAYGALVRGQAACSGYARAFKALCDAMGVSCYYIHSTGNDHQWNLVEFNDGYYFVDVQANDSSGFDWIYHSSEHPYPYDTAQFLAVGSKSGQNTAGTSETEEESNTEIPNRFSACGPMAIPAINQPRMDGSFSLEISLPAIKAITMAANNRSKSMAMSISSAPSCYFVDESVCILKYITYRRIRLYLLR